MRHNQLSLTDDLKRFGIKEGDVIFVGADLSRIGSIEGRIGEVIINSFLDAVGKEGTIITNAFTKSFFISKIDESYVYDRNSKSESGSLAKLFLKHPDCIRSRHPTNSFVAIGKNAEYLLHDHDETKSSYFPLLKIMELNGKHMLLGCVDSQNGLASIHCAQEALGLTKRNILKGKLGVYFIKDDKKTIFKKSDIGGCSRGFYKFYNHFLINNVLLSGYYGDAYTVLVSAKASFEIVCKVLQENPRFALCDDPDCFYCRGTQLYNKRDMPFYYIKNIFYLLRKYISR